MGLINHIEGLELNQKHLLVARKLYTKNSNRLLGPKGAIARWLILISLTMYVKSNGKDAGFGTKG